MFDWLQKQSNIFKNDDYTSSPGRKNAFSGVLSKYNYGLHLNMPQYCEKTVMTFHYSENVLTENSEEKTSHS